MNTLILALITCLNSGDTNSVATKDYSWVLDEMQEATEVFIDLDIPLNRIRIFDINGNLMGQYSQEEYIENKLPLSDLKRIQNSEFLFEFQGDSYYLSE